MSYDQEIPVLAVEDLEEELIEITPVAIYEQSDALDLPETGASYSPHGASCSVVLCCCVEE
ncbi:MAG TPA: hypothetical protein VKV40_04145 [Ktedonobacteraceae bacterium]|nr:hypothetical protein [Ktedonobacteraceae bacterium]